MSSLSHSLTREGSTNVWKMGREQALGGAFFYEV